MPSLTPIIYLAGPVTGMTADGAATWRTMVTKRLRPMGLLCVSPVRDAPPLADGETYKVVHEDHSKGGSAAAIRTKTKTDVVLCDVVLAYMPKPEGNGWPSLGTAIEMARAKLMGKTVVLVVDEREPRLAQHPILLDCADAVFYDFNDAIEFIESVLLPYGRAR